MDQFQHHDPDAKLQTGQPGVCGAVERPETEPRVTASPAGLVLRYLRRERSQLTGNRRVLFAVRRPHPNRSQPALPLPAEAQPPAQAHHFLLPIGLVLRGVPEPHGEQRLRHKGLLCVVRVPHQRLLLISLNHSQGSKSRIQRWEFRVAYKFVLKI